MTVPFSVDGQPTVKRDRASANLRAISPGYMSTVGTRLLQGRSFLETDRSNTPPVALVSAALADRFLSGGAVGQRLLIDDNNQGPRPVEIVGVVENVRHTALDLPPALDVYVPLRQIHPDGVPLLRSNQFWMVRAASDPSAFRVTFLTHLRAVDPDAAVSGTGAMREYLDAWLGPRGFNIGLFGAFALTAVVLAVSGLYGLMTYAVAYRTREIGIRMALGAPRDHVLRTEVWSALRLVGIGISNCIPIAITAGRLIGAQHFGVAAGDPVTLAGAAALLILVGGVAAYGPARRASRVDPMLALRTQ